MIKCSICGEQIELRKENRYEVFIKASALQKSFGIKDRLYEAFDCPNCGCQMIMQERFPVKEEAKVVEEHTEECDWQNKVVRSRLSHDECDAIETEWKDDDEVSAENIKIKDETSKFGDDKDKIETTYGSENRKASDVTSDYLSKMTIDELRAFGEENGIYLVGKRSRYYYIEQIRKQVFASKEDEKEE